MDEIADFLLKVSCERDVLTVADLAREIWSEHYTPIIGSEQVAYMVDKFQSKRAIAKQIADEEYCYFLIYHENHAIGYIGLQQQGDILFLSKLYIKKSLRGKGLGKRAVAYIRQFAVQRQCAAIHLTVNRHNTIAIAAYERTGFIFTGELVTDIGAGYVMDDYVYELTL